MGRMGIDTDWAAEKVMWEVLDPHVWFNGEPRYPHIVRIHVDHAYAFTDWLRVYKGLWSWDQDRDSGGMMEIMFQDTSGAMLFKLTFGGV